MERDTQRHPNARYRPIWTVLLLLPSSLGAVEVEIDIGGYTGRWLVDGIPAYEGDRTLDLAPGHHHLGLVGVDNQLVGFNVAADGTVASDDPLRASGGTGRLELLTWTVDVRVNGYAGRWRSGNDQNAPSLHSGDASVVLAAATYTLGLSGVDLRHVEYTVEPGGAVSSSDPTLATGGDRMLSLVTLEVDFDVSGYPGRWRNGADGVAASISLGNDSHHLAPATYQFGLPGVDLFHVRYTLAPSGVVSTSDSALAQGGERSFTLETLEVSFDVSGYPGRWGTGADGVAASIFMGNATSQLAPATYNFGLAGVDLRHVSYTVSPSGLVSVDDSSLASGGTSSFSLVTHPVSFDVGGYHGRWGSGADGVPASIFRGNASTRLAPSRYTLALTNVGPHLEYAVSPSGFVLVADPALGHGGYRRLELVTEPRVVTVLPEDTRWSLGDGAPVFVGWQSLCLPPAIYPIHAASQRFSYESASSTGHSFFEGDGVDVLVQPSAYCGAPATACVRFRAIVTAVHPVGAAPKIGQPITGRFSYDLQPEPSHPGFTNFRFLNDFELDTGDRVFESTRGNLLASPSESSTEVKHYVVRSFTEDSWTPPHEDDGYLLLVPRVRPAFPSLPTRWSISEFESASLSWASSALVEGTRVYLTARIEALEVCMLEPVIRIPEAVIDPERLREPYPISVHVDSPSPIADSTIVFDFDDDRFAIRGVEPGADLPADAVRSLELVSGLDYAVVQLSLQPGSAIEPGVDLELVRLVLEPTSTALTGESIRVALSGETPDGVFSSSIGLFRDGVLEPFAPLPELWNIDIRAPRETAAITICEDLEIPGVGVFTKDFVGTITFERGATHTDPTSGLDEFDVFIHDLDARARDSLLGEVRIRLDRARLSTARAISQIPGLSLPMDFSWELFLDFDLSGLAAPSTAGGEFSHCEPFRDAYELTHFDLFAGNLRLLIPGRNRDPLYLRDVDLPCANDPRPDPAAFVLRSDCPPSTSLSGSSGVVDRSSGSFFKAYVSAESDAPLGAVQLGLELADSSLLEIRSIRPGPDVAPEAVDSFFVRSADDDDALGAGQWVVGIVLTPGAPLDATEPLRILELEVASTETPDPVTGAEPREVELKIVDGLGDPEVESVVAVQLGDTTQSSTPQRTSGSIAVSPDLEPPKLECPDRLVIEALGEDQAVVEFDLVASDPSGVVDVQADPPSGSVFAPGETRVSVLAVDGAGNSALCTFVVEVIVGGRFRRADSNGDGLVNIADPVQTLNWLFATGRMPRCLDAADANDDGSVDVSDALATLNYLFANGLAPTAPGPFECGPDPTNDRLAECEYDACP